MTEKEKQIYKTALNMFVNQGFHGTATSAIAQKSGISNGSLFHYFKSKENLIQSLHKHVKKEQINAIRAGIDELDDPREKVRYIWINAINWAMENKEKYTFLHQYKHSPYRRKSNADVNAFKKDFMDNAEKGVQQKQFRFLPYDFIFELTNAHVYGMVEYLQANPIKYRTPEFMKQSFESFYRSVEP